MPDFTLLPALALECHQTNVNNGFWNIPKTNIMRRLEIIAEISEAIEALREDKVVKIDISDYHFESVSFLWKIKDSFPDEVCDTCIRTMDYCIGNDIEISANYINTHFILLDSLRDKSIDALIEHFERMILEKRETENQFDRAIALLFFIAKKFSFDLIKHIELKNQYNRTRGYLHGKKF